MRAPRHENIIKLIRANGFMPIEDLARELNVTPQTIRRDINQLCEENVLRRYHGGATLGSSIASEDYFSRKSKLQSEKAHIANMVVQHIGDRSSLFLGIGTTVESVAMALTKAREGLCIITNNIHVASIAGARADYNVLITSGVVRAADGGITGVATLDFINQFKVDFAVLGVAAIEADGSLLDYDYKEVSVTQAMMANARQRFLVADHTKFGRNALVRMGHMNEFDAVFTDNELGAELQTQLDQAGVAVYLA